MESDPRSTLWMSASPHFDLFSRRQDIVRNNVIFQDAIEQNQCTSFGKECSMIEWSLRAPILSDEWHTYVPGVITYARLGVQVSLPSNYSKSWEIQNTEYKKIRWEQKWDSTYSYFQQFCRTLLKLIRRIQFEDENKNE